MKLLFCTALLAVGAFAQTKEITGTVTSTFSASTRETVAGALATVQLDITYPDTLGEGEAYPLPVTVGNDAVTIIRNFADRQAGPEAYAVAVAKGLMEKYPLIAGVTVSVVYTQSTYIVAQRISKTIPAAQQSQVAAALAEARRMARPQP